MKMKVKVKNGAQLKDYFKYKSKRGLKTSQKRLFIIDYFLSEDRHFSIEELYHEIRKINSQISFSTVYRTLRLLTDCGLAQECCFAEGMVRYEPVHKAQHHDHLICRKCGRIIEFENNEIEKLQNHVAKKFGFLVVSHALELYGLCNMCQKKQRRS